MDIKRSSGILLHVSSLPGKYGIGDVGQNAYKWVDFLESIGTKYWQILPLNPTGYGNSPYQGLSAFSGNPLFIDLDDLIELGLLRKNELGTLPKFPLRKVNFKKVTSWKTEKLRKAFMVFSGNINHDLNVEFNEFKKVRASWLKDYSLFMALREEYQTVSWNHWPDSLRMREKESLQKFIIAKNEKIEFHQFLQFIFSRQWGKLKKYTNSRGIQLIGDIPIFVGYDCADVWARPQLFQLDENLKPAAVAGVPPDFFSETGQLWGNPLYDWKAHKKEGYAWWITRIKETLKTVDLIRLDHFRGFAGYYRIPAESKTALEGNWISGPGKDFFDILEKELGNLPFIAEDLGVIKPDVLELRDYYRFPGMRILQFAFGGDGSHIYLPYNYPENCVAYTGTHDNNTSRGWYQSATEKEREFCARYLGYHTRDIAHEMIRAVWQSCAAIAIAPMQDFLRLGSFARMNTPSSVGGNWEWRMRPDAVTDKTIDRIKEINTTYMRSIID